MSDENKPQLYLLTPPTFELSDFPAKLARVMDGADIACLRLSMATSDVDVLSRAADAIREVAHARDVALVIDTHIALSERLGLDGVHLNDGARSIRAARKELGPDAIVGSFCAVSRHDGMTAGEASADYVAFGPAGVSALGDGSQADPELFRWWSEMIEVPVVAEGHLDVETIETLAELTDFFAIGEEIWKHDDPLGALETLLAPLN